MEIRIAVGSSDGKVIDQHFGKAVQFVLLDLDTDSGVQKEAGAIHPPALQDTGKHSESRLLGILGLLEGCSAALVSSIGPGALSVAEAHGMAVFCTNGKIEEAIEKLVKSKYFITLIRGFERKNNKNH